MDFEDIIKLDETADLVRSERLSIEYRDKWLKLGIKQRELLREAKDASKVRGREIYKELEVNHKERDEIYLLGMPPEYAEFVIRRRRQRRIKNFVITASLVCLLSLLYVYFL